MKTGWHTDRNGKHKASLSPAIDIAVRAARYVPEGREYGIQIGTLLEVHVLPDDDNAAKRFAEGRCQALLEEAIGRLLVLQESI